MFVKTFTLVFVVSVFAIAQSLTVNTVSPAQNSNNVPTNSIITIEFDVPVNISQLDSHFVVQGNMSNIIPVQVIIDSSNITVSLIPQKDFLLGEKVNVLLQNKLTGANGENFNGYQWRFNIQPSLQTHPYFTPPTIYSQFGGHYIVPVDIDFDDDIDILFSTSIIQNNGNGGFSHFQFLNSSGSGKPILFDLENDGNRNLWVYPFFYEQGPGYSFQYDTTMFDEIVAIKI